MRKASSEPRAPVRYGVLSDGQINDIHLAALEVLRRTGVRFYHSEALQLLQRAGAFISDGNVVKFPSRLVEQAVASAPSRIVMSDRDGEPAMFLEGQRTYYGTGSDCLNLLDHRNGQHRAFTTDDLVDGYRLCDALPNIDFVMSIGIPSNVDRAIAFDIQMALMLEHTAKPIVFVTNDKASCLRAIDMAAVVAGGNEALKEQQHILLYTEPSSPLKHSENAVGKLLIMADNDLPIVHSPGVMMGATAPITLAGGLVMSVAEVLSGLVLHQLRKPGAPFVFGIGLHHMDMSSVQICYASPEFELTKAAVRELGRWYGLPTWGYAGCSDSKLMDGQAAADAMLSVVMSKLSGVNLVHDVGYMENGLTTSFDMIVLTDELIGLSNHLSKGIEVSDTTLLVDEINRIGSDGSYLDADSTLHRYRDFWYPSMMDRRIRWQWLDDGGTTLADRLKDKTSRIINEHDPTPLPAGIKNKIQDIVSEAS